MVKLRWRSEPLLLLSTFLVFLSLAEETTENVKGNTTGPCDPNPCTNGGKCIEQDENFTCNCVTEFTGDTCSERDWCQLLGEIAGCEDGSSCRSLQDPKEGQIYECVCPDEGHFYNYNIRQCQPLCARNPCRNEGECVMQGENFECKCKPGSYGKTCENIDWCIRAGNAVCLDGSTCQPLSQQKLGRSYECVCPQEQDYYNYITGKCVYNGCYGRKCYNKSTCFSNSTTHECQCYEGWYPPLCLKRDPCRWKNHVLVVTNSICNHHGECIPMRDQHRCKCHQGWLESDCSRKDLCLWEGDKVVNATVKCGEHGKCEAVGNQPVCKCNEGYKGDDCRVKDPCLWEGNKVVNATAKCGEHGKCEDVDNQAVCRCDEGYLGNSCSVKDPCRWTKKLVTPEEKCSNHGTCILVEGKAECKCEGGWMGTACSVCGAGWLKKCMEKDPCRWEGDQLVDETSKCGEFGNCMSDGDQHKCDCSGGWKQPDCKVCSEGWLQPNCTAKDPCRWENDKLIGQKSLCNNHGTCEFNEQKQICQCDEGWMGENCREINPCLWNGDELVKPDSKCGEHGVCIPKDQKHECVCDDGWMGQNCSQRNPCRWKNGKLVEQNVNCNNHGMCLPNGDEYTCRCSGGWKLPHCSECQEGWLKPECMKKNPCRWEGSKLVDEKAKCGPYGTCESLVNNHRCTCSGGWTSTDCSVCSDGWVKPKCLIKDSCRWEGDTLVNSTVKCGEHGTCSANGEQHICHCDEGYMEEDCSVQNPCLWQEGKLVNSSTKCGGHGRCELKENKPECKCHGGWLPSDCQKCADGWLKPDCLDKDPCRWQGSKLVNSSEMCSGHGTCKSSKNKHTCTCEEGWLEADCSRKDPCRWEEGETVSNTSKCGTNALCEAMPGNVRNDETSYRCLCHNEDSAWDRNTKNCTEIDWCPVTIFDNCKPGEICMENKCVCKGNDTIGICNPHDFCSDSHCASLNALCTTSLTAGDENDNYTCVCPYGMGKNSEGKCPEPCTNSDSCTESSAICVTRNTDTSGYCGCPAGWYRDAEKKECIPARSSIRGSLTARIKNAESDEERVALLQHQMMTTLSTLYGTSPMDVKISGFRTNNGIDLETNQILVAQSTNVTSLAQTKPKVTERAVSIECDFSAEFKEKIEELVASPLEHVCVYKNDSDQFCLIPPDLAVKKGSFTIKETEGNMCPDIDYMCPGSTTGCKKETDNIYACGCKRGFTRLGLHSINFNRTFDKNFTLNIEICDSCPCENGGECIEENDMLSCKCKNGYSGKFCSSKDKEDEVQAAELNIIIISSVLGVAVIVMSIALIVCAIQRRKHASCALESNPSHQQGRPSAPSSSVL